MSEQLDENLQEFLEIRQPGVDYEEHKQDDEFALQLGVDLDELQEVPAGRRQRDLQEGRPRSAAARSGDPSVDLPDYSGPFNADLRFSDFAQEQLVRMLSMSYEYYVLLVESWAAEVARRFGDDAMQELQTAAWTDGVLPHVVAHHRGVAGLRRVDEMPELGAGVVAFSPFKPDPRYAECDKERLVNLFLGSHEFLLLVIESWAARSSCGTGSTRCSTSSGRSGARRCCPKCATQGRGG